MMNSGKMAPEQKRRKIEPPPLRRPALSNAGNENGDLSVGGLKVPSTPATDYRIQQAKNFAVAQAQQDGSTGNFIIFDSPFGEEPAILETLAVTEALQESARRSIPRIEVEAWEEICKRLYKH